MASARPTIFPRQFRHDPVVGRDDFSISVMGWHHGDSQVVIVDGAHEDVLVVTRILGSLFAYACAISSVPSVLQLLTM